MSYTVKTKGKPSFRTIDLMCENCGYHEEYSVDLRDKETDQDIELAMNPEIRCPNCEEADLQRVWLQAPSVGRFTNDNSSAAFEARKASFRERFVKKELDDVRNKHGKLFDESLRSAAAQRIKKDEAPT